MARERVYSGMKYEKILGYCSALRDGEMIYVSGTLGLDYATHSLPAGAGAQAERCVDIIREALDGFGATLADVLRVSKRLYNPDVLTVVIVGPDAGAAAPAAKAAPAKAPGRAEKK